MKNLYLTALLVIASLALEAQTVAIVDYMKVPDNGDANYLAVEKQWKTLHQNRVESGKILSWRLWYIRNSGTSSSYNYATVTTYENFGKTETQLTEAELKQAFGANMDELFAKTSASRSLTKSETIHLQASITSEVQDKYLVVNLIKTDNVDDYINMEKVGYLPLHEESKKLGQRNSWRLWTRWPYEDNSFQAVVVDGYTKFENIENADYGLAIENVIAGKKSGEIMSMMDQISRTDEIRTIVKSEIWEFVDGTTPKAK